MGFWDFQDWFGGYDEGAANAARQAQAEQAAAQQAAAQAAASQTAAQESARLQAVRDAATGSARTGAQSYFSERGLDPNAYSGNIESELQKLLGGISADDPAPGRYLANLGETAFTSAQNAARDRATGAFNQAFAPDYEFGRIGSTLDDPFISQIDAAERGKADEYINRLLNRGVITGTGAAGARQDVEEQGAGVRSRLQTLGSDILSEGRSGLSDILSRARGTAGNLALGQTFDPSRYQSELDQSFNDFLGGLGDRIKGSFSGPLYDTGNLAAAAGTASGAQNTKFDPFALAGLEEPEDPLGKTPQKKRTFF